MDLQAFDDLMAATDPAMAIVTTASGAERSGCLVGFHGQASIEPRRYAVWISKANHTFGLAVDAAHFAVHLLTDADHELARTFGTLTGDDDDKFALVETRTGPHGVPILAACGHRLVGAKVSLVDDGGDHVCVVLDPTDVWSGGSFTPLRLSDVGDLTPAHEAGEGT